MFRNPNNNNLMDVNITINRKWLSKHAKNTKINK